MKYLNMIYSDLNNLSIKHADFYSNSDRMPLVTVLNICLTGLVLYRYNKLVIVSIHDIRADDGGLYKCIATNSMGSIEHAARLNVYGK